MFRLFYREVDVTPFEIRVRSANPFTGFSTDMNHPTLHSGQETIELETVVSVNWDDAYPVSGVVKDSVVIHYNFRPEGSDEWEGNQTISAPLGGGPVPFPLRAGLYMFNAQAESGAGTQAISIPRYLKVSWLKLTHYPVGGWYSAGTPLDLEVQVANAGSDVSYQWLHNDVPIVGATGSVCRISSLSLSDSGSYSCLVSAGNKGSLVTPAAEYQVHAPGALPTLGMWGVLLLAAGILGGYRIVRRSSVRF
jgi:hypothetical protein